MSILYVFAEGILGQRLSRRLHWQAVVVFVDDDVYGEIRVGTPTRLLQVIRFIYLRINELVDSPPYLEKNSWKRLKTIGVSMWP